MNRFNPFGTSCNCEFHSNLFSHWRWTPFFGVRVTVGTVSTGLSSVFSDGRNLKARKIRAIVNFVSSNANLIPTQFLGPPPKGIQDMEAWVFLLAGLNRSGSKRNGSGQSSGSWWISQTGTWMLILGGIWYDPSWIDFSFSRITNATTGGYRRRDSQMIWSK